jgi:hypothetical protein
MQAFIIFSAFNMAGALFSFFHLNKKIVKDDLIKYFALLEIAFTAFSFLTVLICLFSFLERNDSDLLHHLIDEQPTLTWISLASTTCVVHFGLSILILQTCYSKTQKTKGSLIGSL